MRIRPATPADLDAVAALHRRSILTLCGGHYTPAQLTEWTAVLLPAAYVMLRETRTMLVADDGGALLGFGVVDPAESIINATYVSPEAPRRGVGRRLMAAMEDAARDRGCTRLRLNATRNAVPFYEALGYAREGDATNRLPSGVELPCVAMSRSLDGAV